MSLKKPIYSLETVGKWKLNKLKNPLTGRLLKKDGKIYKQFEYAELYYEKNKDNKDNAEIKDKKIINTKNSGVIGEKTYSITFGDRVENHQGMQMIGELKVAGLSLPDIKISYLPIDIDIPPIIDNFDYKRLRIDANVYDLNSLLEGKYQADQAYLSVLEGGVDKIWGKGAADKLLSEMEGLEYDKKALMKGRVVNKIARWNNCIADFSQTPDYAAGKGTVIDFKNVPVLSKIREGLPKIYGQKAKNLLAETNFYYNKQCNIGYHGDTERRIVICIRLGADFPLHYQWYQNCGPVGKKFSITLKHGDIYAMTEKAVGFDWKTQLTPTLRHAAGFGL
jgi:hypothetical protein